MSTESYSLLQSTHEKADELAAQVLPQEWLDSWRRLDVEAKLVGIKFFAALDDNQRMIDAADARLQTLRAR